ncbi:Acetyltransferase (GNAT) family protein [Amycolatopsis xylanica]|uniref:Acetyltransferase (GNAT) family protein n=1 Tax=Amycolatopsis xylanica TaxID=589385 RepID=A0A1H3M9H4_9PSEU|nr:GNAT family N-acetyltransferase [Amycolatopsis xylanica]SDY73243.1 Acetyltransferase (GNAT) family protein [Amycolatopsis xylanica]
MNAAETLEVACTAAWDPLISESLGQWRLRWAGGFTGRANSALAVGDPGVPIGQALRRVCDFAHSRHIEPRVHAIKDSDIEDALAAEGWKPDIEYANGHEVTVLTGPLGDGDTTLVLDEPAPAWWELTTGSADPSPAQRHVLATGKVGFGMLGDFAAVRGAVAEGILLVGRLAVRPPHRRQGHAVTLMNAIGAWGAGHGAARCVLQVSVTNAAALSLYARLGFSEHHRYRYWIPA